MFSLCHEDSWRTASVRKMLATLAVVLVCQPLVALAHHMTAGEAPRSFVEGLLSGFAHPLIGPDHLAFILAVGLITAAVAGGRAALPVAFLSASLAGCVLRLTTLSVMGSEVAVAVSVVAVGAVIVANKQVHLWRLAIGFAVAGVVHGYGYGESMVGTEPAPLVAYLLGLTVIQYVMIRGACAAARLLDRRALPVRALAMRAAGVTVGLTGFVSFAVAVV